jgi:hypothetical protein
MEILPLGDKKGEAAAYDLYKGYFWEEILQTRKGKKKKKLKSPYLHHTFLHVVSIYSRVSRNFYFSLNL